MLQIRDVQKIYPAEGRGQPDHVALYPINLEIQEAEFFSLLGPSGCGKTTLLRILAGLETIPGQNHILWKGRDLTATPPQERPFNMVFQKHALFPHLNVFDNIVFGLRVKKLKDAEIKARFDKVISLIQLEGFESRSVQTLSGGQSQRVALARALINEPEVLLLDEPLSALDHKLRLAMQSELKKLQQRLGITFIYVTHDQQEAFRMSTRIAVMNKGRLEQVGSPGDIKNNPTSEFVKDFVDPMGTDHD